jgi:hypothetical protein
MKFDTCSDPWYSFYRQHEAGSDKRILKIAMGWPEGCLVCGDLYSMEAQRVRGQGVL